MFKSLFVLLLCGFVAGSVVAEQCEVDIQIQAEEQEDISCLIQQDQQIDQELAAIVISGFSRTYSFVKFDVPKEKYEQSEKLEENQVQGKKKERNFIEALFNWVTGRQAQEDKAQQIQENNARQEVNKLLHFLTDQFSDVLADKSADDFLRFSRLKVSISTYNSILFRLQLTDIHNGIIGDAECWVTINDPRYLKALARSYYLKVDIKNLVQETLKVSLTAYLNPNNQKMSKNSFEHNLGIAIESLISEYLKNPRAIASDEHYQWMKNGYSDPIIDVSNCQEKILVEVETKDMWPPSYFKNLGSPEERKTQLSGKKVKLEFEIISEKQLKVCLVKIDQGLKEYLVCANIVINDSRYLKSIFESNEAFTELRLKKMLLKRMIKIYTAESRFDDPFLDAQEHNANLAMDIEKIIRPAASNFEERQLRSQIKADARQAAFEKYYKEQIGKSDEELERESARVAIKLFQDSLHVIGLKLLEDQAWSRIKSAALKQNNIGMRLDHSDNNVQFAVKRMEIVDRIQSILNSELREVVNAPFNRIPQEVRDYLVYALVEAIDIKSLMTDGFEVFRHNEKETPKFIFEELKKFYPALDKAILR